MLPSNFDDLLLELRNSVRRRLKSEGERIISEETERVLGRVKIIRVDDLTGEYWWNIEPKPETTKEKS